MDGSVLHDKSVFDAMSAAVKDSNAVLSYETKADYHSDGMIIEEANFSYNQTVGDGYSMYSHLNLKLMTEDDGK